MATASMLTLDLAPEADSVRRARDALSDWCPGHPRLDDALLCISEVVTNAVLHARTAAVAHLIAYDGVLRVEVHDRSRDLPVHKHYGIRAPSGRGLHLLDAVSDRWGVQAGPDGKLIWFELIGAQGDGTG